MKAGALLKRQRGLAAVELAIVATVVLVVLFGVLEAGRLLWTWNMLNEVTRRAARLAAVCPVDSTTQANVRNTAVFGGGMLSGLQSAHVILQYLDRDGAVLANPGGADFVRIAFVRAAIDNGANGYRYRLLIPLHIQTLAPLRFSTTVVAESLGVSPVGTGTTSC